MLNQKHKDSAPGRIGTSGKQPDHPRCSVPADAEKPGTATAEARKEANPFRVHAKGHPALAFIECNEDFARKKFWKEALESDSLLSWIVFNIGHIREERT